jgi:hypothetical protein
MASGRESRKARFREPIAQLPLLAKSASLTRVDPAEDMWAYTGWRFVGGLREDFQARLSAH